jgi:hypothetical protein
MAEIQNWQKQSMAKNGGCSAPTQMNPKLLPTGAAAGLHKKIATPSFGMGGVVGTLTAGKTVRKFADGGEVQYDQGEFAGVDKAVADMASGPDALDKENYDGTTREKIATDDQVRAAADEGAAMPKSFKEAFAENRKAGNATFEYNGKSFTTELAGSKPAASKPSESRKQMAAAFKTAASGPVRGADFDPDSMDNFSGSKPKAAAPAPAPTAARVIQPRGKGVIDTSNIDPKTLLPRR